MNYFELINAVLEQLDLPRLQSFSDAKLPMHTRIMEYINRANKDIITYHDWIFKKQFQQNESSNTGQTQEDENCHCKIKKCISENKKQFFVINVFDEPATDFENEFDKSILPEPYGSEMIIYWTTMEIKQEPNNPKYGHWQQRYYKAYSELNAADCKCLKNPVFRIKRG